MNNSFRGTAGVQKGLGMVGEVVHELLADGGLLPPGGVGEEGAHGLPVGLELLRNRAQPGWKERTELTPWA